MRPFEARIGSALFFLLAPGVIAGLVPYWITRWRIGPGASPVLSVIGGVLMLAFAAMLIDCFARFAAHNGTPAPVAPPQELVVTGLYRYVRNPMYIAVGGLIFAQALLFASADLLAYGAVIVVAFAVFVAGYEEPTLAGAYGQAYDSYRRNVPAWLPRLTPWRGENNENK